MAVKLEFYISDDDMDRIWAIKEQKAQKDTHGMGYGKMSGNDFARWLIEGELYRLHPRRVEMVEE